MKYNENHCKYHNFRWFCFLEKASRSTDRVKKNVSIDWTIKESVRAKLKVIIKRTLRQYGYPSDMQRIATEKVLKQAEMIAEEITKG